MFTLDENDDRIDEARSFLQAVLLSRIAQFEDTRMFDLDTISDDDDILPLDGALDAILEQFFKTGATTGIVNIDGVDIEYSISFDDLELDIYVDY